VTLGNFVLARALFTLAAWLLPAAVPALEPEPPGKRSVSVFRIQVADAQRRVVSGTGVLVAARTLVTNCHVVLDAHEISVIGTARTHHASIARSDVERDLCLLEVPALDAPVAVLGDTRKLRPGETIAAGGYSTGGVLAWTTGRIEGLFSYHSSGRVIQGSAPFDEGASGGGLFDGNGRLVGILTFKARAGGPFHFAVPVEWVTDLLANRSRARRSDATSAFWQHTDTRQPTFLRAASHAARGDCAALAEVAEQWLRDEPGNPEADMTARSVRRCHARAARGAD
jgi:serine protease Do